MTLGPRHTERAWTDFAGWCRARRLRALPAHPWTVAAYARWCETRHRYPVVLERIRAIARVHLLECAPAPDRHPTVARTLRTLEARSHARATRAGLFAAQEPAESVPEQPAKAASARVPRRKALRKSPKLVLRRPNIG